jgi:hypothetical protein
MNRASTILKESDSKNRLQNAAKLAQAADGRGRHQSTGVNQQPIYVQVVVPSR